MSPEFLSILIKNENLLIVPLEGRRGTRCRLGEILRTKDSRTDQEYGRQRTCIEAQPLRIVPGANLLKGVPPFPLLDLGNTGYDPPPVRRADAGPAGASRSPSAAPCGPWS